MQKRNLKKKTSYKMWIKDKRENIIKEIIITRNNSKVKKK